LIRCKNDNLEGEYRQTAYRKSIIRVRINGRLLITTMSRDYSLKHAFTVTRRTWWKQKRNMSAVHVFLMIMRRFE
jgi:hypothetical protein